MAPRPILKSQQDSDGPAPDEPPLPFPACSPIAALRSPHVHFPPTPVLAETHSAYSPATYDRAPIQVSPNACELPERGERVYMPTCREDDDGPWAKRDVKGSYFHPRAFEACQLEPAARPGAPLAPPPLIPDLSSSDSDESDGPMTTPPDPHAIPRDPLHVSIPRELDTAHVLAFLPHPPASPRDRDRDRDHPKDRALAAGCQAPPSPSPPSRPRLRRRSGSSLKAASEFEVPRLDGCLGGF